ncbi:hypothetical protein ACP70R_014426 [Stipagrostis hirtigluma subsp. patula]
MCGGPAPIKMRFLVPHPPEPKAEVTDVGSSAPSTPSSSGSTGAPFAALSAAFSAPETPVHASYATPEQMMAMSTTAVPPGVVWGLPAAPQMPPLSLPPFKTAAAAPRVVVRQVWPHNFEEEAKLIESLLPRFRYAAVDTEFPGTVYRPAAPAYMLTPEKLYALLKANVDELDLIQLGLTLFDAGCRLPDLGAGAAVRHVWEFNFREFDVRRHRHAPESVAMLRAKGVDFGRTRREGVRAAAFGPRLRKWLRAGLGRAGVVTFSGGYDLAYLVKVMFGPGYKLPATAPEFEAVAKALLRRKLFDVKEMARHCPSDLRGGLESVAGKLDVARAVGEAHQAGSDSLLTCQTFIKMRERYFDDDKLTMVAGMLGGINAR